MIRLCEWDTCSHFWSRDPDCHFVFQSNTKLNEVSILENKINWVLLGRARLLLCSCKYRTNIYQGDEGDPVSLPPAPIDGQCISRLGTRSTLSYVYAADS